MSNPLDEDLRTKDWHKEWFGEEASRKVTEHYAVRGVAPLLALATILLTPLLLPIMRFWPEASTALIFWWIIIGVIGVWESIER